ncbi:putative metal chaperone YciC [compost metagenome]
MQAFLKVLSLPERPDRVLVESSGVGDPARIADMGRAGGHFRCEGVITVVDAEAVQRLARDRYVGDTVRAQLRAADLLLVNKTDLVTPLALTQLRSWLGSRAPGVPLLESRMGEVDAQLILGPVLHAEDAAPAAQDPALDHATRFVSTSLTTTYPLQRQALEAALNALPAHVLRAKGLVFLEGENAPRVLQLCGKRWSLEPPGPEQTTQRSRIVFIAARDPQAAPFHPWSHFGAALAQTSAAESAPHLARPRPAA